MNAHNHPRPDPLAITHQQIDDIVNRAIALRASPSRGSYAYLALLCAIDTVEGMGSLDSTISDLESDLGVGDADEPQCLACGGSSCGCDQAHDDRSAWGLSLHGASGSGYWL